jgi:hypothetical protein
VTVPKASAMSAERHDMAIRHIFPRMARVVRSAAVGFPAA